MKRWLLFVLSLLAIAIVAFYVSIPREIAISKGVFVKANAIGAGRILNDSSNWKKLWPENEKGSAKDGQLYFNGFNYHFAKKNYNTFEVSLKEEPGYEGSILFALLNVDSMGIEWRGKLTVGNNPIDRFKGYFHEKKIRRNLDDILYALKVYLEDNKNIYGTTITQTKIADSVMISMIRTFNAKPGTNEMYAMINPLKEYAKEKGARETNYPMMGILPADSNHFKIITAVPIDRTLPEHGEFIIKRMLFNGNNLATEIKGGPFAISNAYKQMNNYIVENQRTLAVAPFEFFVTDRLKEPDTSKWVTILNYPVY